MRSGSGRQVSVQPAEQVGEDLLALGLVEHFVVQALVSVQSLICRRHGVVHHRRAGQRAYPVVRSMQQQQRHGQSRQPGGQALHCRQNLGSGSSFDLASVHQRILVVGPHYRRVPADLLGAKRRDSQVGDQRREQSRKPSLQRRAGRHLHRRPRHNQPSQQDARLGVVGFSGVGFSGIVQRDEAAERVTDHEHRHTGMSLRGEQYKGAQVVHDQSHPLDIASSPAGTTVSTVVGGIDREARSGQPGAHVCVARRVFMDTVHDDDERPGRVRGKPRLPIRGLVGRDLPVSLLIFGAHRPPPSRVRDGSRPRSPSLLPFHSG